MATRTRTAAAARAAKKPSIERQELSLLLYLETCAVDHAGKVEAQRMNKDDFEIADRWAASTFIAFSRLPSWYMLNHGGTMQFTHRVILSEDAWLMAHAERRERSKRVNKDFDGVLLKGEQ